MRTSMKIATTAQPGGMRVETVAKVFAVALPMVLMGGLPASAQAPARAPIGTITMLQDAGQIGGKAVAYDVRRPDPDQREIVAATSAHARSVDASTVPSTQDSPVGRMDATVQAAVDSCRDAKMGEKLPPACVDQLIAAGMNAALVHGRPREALDLDRNARSAGRPARARSDFEAMLARMGARKR